MIAAVGVVIPAHDEEDLLPSCLAAVRLAAAPLAGIGVHVVVVADACTDQTARLARAGGAAVLDIQARSVGAARAAGVAEVLRRTGPLDPASVWLATTDADTLVPPCWLTRQLRYAEGGWDAVVGTVTVTDWRPVPGRAAAAVRAALRPAGTDAPVARATRTCTGPTWASARPRTWLRAVSGRPGPPRTTRWSARSPPRAAGSCAPPR